MESLSPERWHRLEELLDAVLDLSPEASTAFLDEACADDPALRAEVDAMIEADARAGLFLQEPVGAVAATLLREAHAASMGPAGNSDQRIGPYRLVKEIGRGGMGTVYLAERADGAFDQRVALKVARSGLGAASIRRRFLHERQILARLQHPHIARLYDGGLSDDGQPYFAMAYVEGTPFTTYCDDRRLPLEDRLHLFIDVGEAVQYAHRNLVVHRDLKPSNILVTDEGDVKLLDFGIAKVLAEEDTPLAEALPMTRTGMQVMTPEYAAPEQISGTAVTTATDVYALGVVLYELLTGHRPYRLDRQTAGAVEHAILEHEPERPSTAINQVAERLQADGTTVTITPASVSAARGTPVERLRKRLRGDLDTVLLKALRKEPERRYASAEAFVEDIQRYLAGLPVRAQADTVGYRATKFMRRNRAMVVAGVLVLLSLVGGLAVSLWQAHVAAEERDRVQLQAQKTEAVKDFLLGVFNVADPSESRGATVTAQELLDRGALRVRTELRDQPALLAEMKGAIGSVYRQLGLLQKSEPLLQEAMQMQETLNDEASDAYAQSLEQLALLRYEQGDFEAAIAYFREAVAQRKQFAGSTARQLARTEYYLGVLLLENGDMAEADSLLVRALETREQVGTPVEVAETMSSLGLLKLDEGTYEEAEPLLQQALTSQQEHLGTDHPATAETLHGLAQLYWNTGLLDNAEPLFREVLAVSRKLYGDTSSVVALDYNSLGLLLMDSGRHEEAEIHFLKALALQQRLLGDEHPDVSATIYNLGSLYRMMERYSEAEERLQRALDLDRTLFGEAHPNVAIDKTNLAAVLAVTARYDEAQQLLDEAMAVFLEFYGDEHHRIAITKIRLGQLAYERNNYEEAVALLQEGYTIAKETWRSGSWRITEARAYLGLALVALGRQDEAQPLFQEILPSLEHLFGPTHTLVQRVRNASQGG